MSHERTLGQWIQEIEHLTGVKVRLRWMPFFGHYLEDGETGAEHSLGSATRGMILEPEEQESICRGLSRESWIILLGLDPPQDED